VTFTATVSAVAPGSGTPTGSVTFFDNGTSLGTGVLSGGVATLSTASLSVGTHPITATYTGSVNFTSSTSNQVNQVVGKANTTTTLVSSPNPSAFSTPATFTATITANAPGAGTATGNVTFTIDASTIVVPVDANGRAAYVTTTLSIGAHSAAAAYGGDVSFNPSNGTLAGGHQVVDTPITDLSAVNSSPTRLDDTTFFTVTATGTNITYTWNFGDGAPATNGSTTSHVYAAAGSYTASVTATNGVSVVVATMPVAIVNLAPVANAGPDQSLLISTSVQLDGSGSLDPDGHNPITYGWQQTGGTPVVLSSSTISRPTFTAPATPAVLTFTLTVTDAHGLAGAPDQVIVTVNDLSIAGLNAVNNSPTIVGHTTRFTATISSGTNVVYTWNFGDGQAGSGSTASHTYPGAGTYTAIVTATNGTNARSATTLVTIKPVVLYLPLVARNYVRAPDLIVTRINASRNNVQVVIKNQGDAPVVDEFWLDVYVNPTIAPTHVNQTWPMLGSQGLVWGITHAAFSRLQPGGVLTLTIGDNYYMPDLSHVIWPLAVGTPVYAQVDSADANTTYGAVLENHEIAGRLYNNILGPVFSTALFDRPPALALQPMLQRSSGLPLRP
jgi:PKD repeat protein